MPEEGALRTRSSHNTTSQGGRTARLSSIFSHRSLAHPHTHSFFQRLSLMSIVTCPHLMMCLTCNVFSVLHSEYLRRCPLNLQQYMDTLVVHLPASRRRSDNFPYSGTLPLTQSFLAGACCLVLQIRCKAMRLRVDGSVLVLSLVSHRVRGDCEASSHRGPKE